MARTKPYRLRYVKWVRQGRAKRWPLFVTPGGLACDVQFPLPAPRTHEAKKREGCAGVRVLRRW